MKLSKTSKLRFTQHNLPLIFNEISRTLNTAKYAIELYNEGNFKSTFQLEVVLNPLLLN